LAPLIRQWVIDGPAKQGLDRANWTYAELADHLFKTTGIRVGQSAMQAFGAKHGIRPYRPSYRFLRGDPVKQAQAREEIAALKKN
jgi:transposase